MRYAADEKLEIIRLVENSHLGVKRTLDKLGVARPTFYRWYARYQTRGEVGLNSRPTSPTSRCWAGGGSTSQRSWMTTRATSLRGGFAPRCRRLM